MEGFNSNFLSLFFAYQYPKKRGSQSEISGKNAITKIAAVLIAAKGSARSEISSIEIFEIPDAMKRFSPKGGV